MKVIHDIFNEVWKTTKKYLTSDKVDYGEMIVDFCRIADKEYSGNQFARDLCIAAMNEIERRDTGTYGEQSI